MSDESPKNGESVLVCAHVEELAQAVHFFHFDDVEFTRSDGEAGSSSWFMCCGDCYRVCIDRHRAMPDTHVLELCGDLVVGDDVWDSRAIVELVRIPDELEVTIH